MNMRVPGLEPQLMHRHKDGSWAEMDSEPAHRAPASHDPERDWSRWRIFRCRTCDEVLTVHQGEIDIPGSSVPR
jgi:hypothetical protein